MASSPSQLRSLKLRSHLPCSLSKIVRRFSSRKDFNDTEDVKTQNQSPPNPLPNRPLRGERPSFSDPPNRRRGGPNFNVNSNGPRPRPSHPSTSPFNADSQSQPQRDDGDFNISDDAFLDKFKLRHDDSNNHKAAPNPEPSNPPTTDTNASAAKNVREGPSKSEPPQDAQEIFKKMKETGLIPNAVAMLDGLCKDGLVQEAMKLFGTMRQKGTIPEVVVYTAVVDGFCKAHKLDDAKRIFRKMQFNGITPNAFSYGVLIQGLNTCNFLEDAIHFCLEMLEAGHSPNVTTFVGLVDGLCREKGVEETKRVIGTLRQKGFYVHDKAVREYLDKNKPLSSDVWEAIFGKKPSLRFLDSSS